MTTDCATSRRVRPASPLAAADDAAPDPEFVARLRTRLVAAAGRRSGIGAPDPGTW